MKRIWILALAMVLCGFTGLAQAADGSWDAVKKEGKLEIGRAHV